MNFLEPLKNPFIAVPAALAGAAGAVLAIGNTTRSFPLAIAIVIALASFIGVVVLYRRLKSMEPSKPKPRPVTAGAQAEPAPPDEPSPAPASPDATRTQIATELLGVLRDLRATSPGRAKLPRFLVTRLGSEPTTAAIPRLRRLLSGPAAPPAGSEAILPRVGGWFDQRALYVVVQAPDPSERAVSSEELTELSKAFRRGGKERPLDGIIVDLSVDDIAPARGEWMDTSTMILADRVRILSSHIGWKLPVYLLLGDGARLTGFSEWFDDLSEDDRRKPCGFLITKHGADTVAARFGSGLEAFARHLPGGHRGGSEPGKTTVLERALLFPLQVRRLRDPLRRLVEVFTARVDGGGFVRGLHIASAEPEGERVDYGVPPNAEALGVEGDEPDPPVGWRAGQWFNADLTSAVLIRDLGIAELTDAEIRRRRRRQIIRLAGSGVAFVLTLSIIGIQCGSNRRLVGEVAQSAEVVRSTVTLGAPLETNLQLLDRLRAQLQVLDSLEAHLPLGRRMGAYAGGRLRDPVGGLYAARTMDVLLRPVVEQMESRLQLMNLTGSGSLPEYYGTFRAWWLLTEPEQIRPEDRHVLAKHVGQAAEARFGQSIPLAAESRAMIDRQVGLLVTHRQWLNPLVRTRSPAQQELVSAAILRLRKDWKVEPFYDELIADLEPRTRPLSFATWFGNEKTLSGSFVVPGPYTRDGFLGTVGPRMADFYSMVERDDVLKQALGVVPDPRPALDPLYADHYVRAWVNFLGNIQRPISRRDAAPRFAATPSPLVALLDSVRAQTLPFEKASDALTTVSKEFAVLNAFFTEMAVDEPSPAKRGGFGCMGPRSAAALTEHEAYVQRLSLAAAEIAQAPDSPIQDQDNQLQLKAGMSNATTKVNGLCDRFKGSAGTPPVKRLLLMPLAYRVSPYDGIEQEGPQPQQQQQQQQQLSQDCVDINSVMRQQWNDLVVAGSQPLLTRFPFAASTEEVTPQEFIAYFGPGGPVDLFYQQFLAPALRPDGSERAPGSATTLCDPIIKTYTQAARIRSAFFPQSMNDCQVALKFTTNQAWMVTQASLPSSVSLTISGVTFRYEMGPQETSQMTWSSSAIDPIVALTAPGHPTQQFEGHWALFRLLAKAKVTSSGNSVTAKWKMTTTGGQTIEVPYRIETLGPNVANPCDRTFFTAFKPGML